MAKIVTVQKGRTQVRYIGVALPELGKTMLTALEQALVHTIMYWHRTYAPMHFNSQAWARYGGREANVYQERAYRGASAKQRSRQAPLVAPFRHRDYSGTLVSPGTLRKAFLSGSMVIKPQGKSQRNLKVIATWPSLPRYTYVDKHGRTRAQGPKKYAELTITSDAEAADMEKQLAAFLDAELAKAADGQQTQAAA